MKIPTTTIEKPYIEFSFDEKGKMSLKTSSFWWGGKNARFISSTREGNTCLPKDLQTYIKAFKLKKIKDIEKEISTLQIKLTNLKK